MSTNRLQCKKEPFQEVSSQNFETIKKNTETQKKLNCWEVMKCEREPGGKKVNERGICPAAASIQFNGVMGGENSGRACYLVTGTLCEGKRQGTFSEKYKDCRQCKFFNQLEKEEGTLFNEYIRLFLE